jgi:hypothetical protein
MSGFVIPLTVLGRIVGRFPIRPPNLLGPVTDDRPGGLTLMRDVCSCVRVFLRSAEEVRSHEKLQNSVARGSIESPQSLALLFRQDQAWDFPIFRSNEPDPVGNGVV